MNSLVKKCSWFSTDAGLLVLRLGIGALFIFNGYMKVSNLSGTVAMFATMGFSAFWAYLVSFVELLGGIMVLFGIWTRLAGFVLSIVMIVAVYVTHKDMMMVMTPAITLFATLSLMLGGSGKFSLDSKLCKKGTAPTMPQA